MHAELSKYAGVLGLVAISVFTTLSACGTAQSVTRRGDLDVTLSRHHVDMRWGRVPEAARFVHPDLRGAFVEDWTRRAREIEITEVEVLQVFEGAEGKSADVTLRIAWIERKTQRLREATTLERWEHGDEGWLCVKVADIDA